MNESFQLYRTAGTDNPTHLDLILAVYDALVRDIVHVADSVAASDIEGRCRWSHHAWLLLGYLETWVQHLEEPELERSLRMFYEHLRRELLRTQANCNEAELRGLAMMVCEMRAVWQQKAVQLSASPLNPESTIATIVQEDKPRLAWSA